jgi:hypothetical protein
MKKKILTIIFICILFFSFNDYVKADRKQFLCKYKYGDKTASFRLRLDKDGKTKAETVDITGDSNGESVVNWDNNNGTGFNGKDYYYNNNACPPYSYFFNGKSGLIDFAKNKFLVSDEPLGGKFENNVRKKYKISGKITVLELVGQTQSEDIDSKQPISCKDFNEKGNSKADPKTAEYYSCEDNPYFACIWNKTEKYGGYCNTDNLKYIKCGDAFDIPHQTPQLISFAVNLLKIATPIILVVISLILQVANFSSCTEETIGNCSFFRFNQGILYGICYNIFTIIGIILIILAYKKKK